MRNAGLLGCVVALLVVLLIVGGYYVSLRNRVVDLDQSVQEKWSEVETQYQRRYDLIPNLVQTVQGAANFEKSTLVEIANARASVGRAQVAAPNAPSDPAAMAQFSAAQSSLFESLRKLMVVVEAYPTLKSNENFLELQSQLEGTENRIQIARGRYNEAVKSYNSTILKFPASLLLSGYKPKNFFKATTPEATEAPKVQFDFGTTATAK
ncbi:MAG TPA: LemA family protein [Thermoanaerobaculia bacterium]|nr:LemA family protein [Thermoanaerobaculia bacterium]